MRPGKSSAPKQGHPNIIFKDEALRNAIDSLPINVPDEHLDPSAHPMFRDMPLQFAGLADPVEGWYCPLCMHAAPSLGTLKHNTTGCRGRGCTSKCPDPWVKHPIQQLGKSARHRKAFAVTLRRPANASIRVGHTVQRLRETLDQRRRIFPASEDVDSRLFPQWLHRLQWPQHVGDMEHDVLMALIVPPRKGDPLCRLLSGVRKMMDLGQAVIKVTDEIVLQLINTESGP